jgi:hypothetical protein
MPTAPRSTPGAVRQPSSQDMDKGKIEAAIVDPKDQDKQIKSVIGTEQAPTLAELSPDTNQWLQFGTQLGPPFDSERVTLTQCRQIRKDPMVAFGMHYRKVPLVRAEWHIDARDNNGPNPQVAAFVDSALRKIYARLILQRELCRDFGYQGIVKRFIFQNPGGMYIDPTEADPTKALKPSWDEGEVLPIIFKAPVALRPETAVPTFDESSGEFTGIAYTAPQGTRTTKKKGKKTTGGANQGVQQIDIYHAYWAVNQKDDEHGSMYGYPLTGFARDYWWSYRFLFMMANRAYERLAIPPVLAYHPEGTTLVDTEAQEYRPNWEIALEAAERLRSNAVAAVPSTMATAGLDASTTQREWDFKFMETPYEALTVFNERFNYLNTMKLRSVWVPELAFVGNGVGGNSAGNIAEQMAQVFDESMALAMDEIDEEINRLWIPQLLAINQPEFINNGGIAKKVSHGFRPEDVEFYKQIIQLIGQTNPEVLAQVDIVEMLRRINAPIKNPEALEVERARLVQESLTAVAPQIPPVTGQVGVVRNPNANPGVTNGGSSPRPALPPAGGTGNGALGFEQPAFIYVAGPEHIDLSDVDDFLANLPASHHYSDKTTRALMLQLRRLWLGYYRNLYPDIAEHVSRTKLELSDLDLTEDQRHEGAAIYMMFANGNSKGGDARRVTKKMADKAARAILKAWQQDSEKLAELQEKSGRLIRKIMDRHYDLTKRETGLPQDMDEDVERIVNDWITNQTGRLIRLTSGTVRDELRAFLADQIIEGKSSTEIADEIRAHFSGFEGHKADRVARSEVRDAVNAATLINGEANRVRYARATDGQLFDKECADRDGKLLTVKEAWAELGKEHPYGTLGFKLLPRLSLSVETVNQLPEGAGDDPDITAWFDSSTDTAFMLMDQPETDKDEFLRAVADLVLS